MKLIKKLPGEKYSNYYQSFGLFYCDYCKKEAKKPLSHGRICRSWGCAQWMGKHGDSKSRLYKIRKDMKGRCLNKNHRQYKNWGGRGITVCDEWKNNYLPFKKWALAHGYRNNLQIDRKNNNGNYTPENCRFITSVENSRNQRTTKLTMEKAEEIRRLYLIAKLPQREIGVMFGISQCHVSAIVTNKKWRKRK